MSTASPVPTSPPVAAPAPVAPAPLTVEPRRLSLNPPTPAPRVQDPDDEVDELATTTSARTTPDHTPRLNRSPLFRPSSALADRDPPAASTSAARSPARPLPSPATASSAKGKAAMHGDLDDLDDDNEIDQLASESASVASTSKAPAPSAPLAPPVKRYAGNFGPPSQPKKRHRMSTAGSGDRSLSYRPPPLPHYTVVRAARNSASSPHVIRIHDNVTDGSSARWPADNECDPKHTVGGRENWYDCQGPDVGRHKMFREKLGEEMAKKLGLSDDDPSAHWVVEKLPKGHLFTVHHCVTSSGHPRQDVYIFGSAATHKFRTVNEFVPHLYWLLSHGPGDGLRCECKYCTKKSQSDVNRIVGLTDGRSSSVVSERSATPRRAAASAVASSASRTGKGMGGGPGHGGYGGHGSSSSTAAKATIAKAGDPGTDKLLPPLKKKKRPRDSERAGSPSAALEHKKARSAADVAGAPGAPSASSTAPPAYRGTFVMRQRDEDLRDVGVPRQGEVVWAKLARPLEPREEGGTTITHWPALVRAREFASAAKVVLEDSSDDGEDDEDDEDEFEADEDEDEMVLVESANGEDKGRGEGAGKGKEAKRRRKEARAKKRAKRAIKKQDAAVELAAASNLEPKTPVPLSTTQRPVFTLALLGLADELRRVELGDTLPWLAHTPPGDLMRPEYIMHPDSAKHVWDGTRTMRDATLADFACAEDAATAVALANQVVAHVVPSFAPGEKYAITSAAIEHKPGTPADQIAAVEKEAAKTWAFQCLFFGAELVWPGDVVRLLNTNLVDLIGPKGAVQPGEDRVFFLRVAILFKAPDADTLKFGGDVWTLDEVADGDESGGSPPKVNGDGVDGPPPANERSSGPVANGNDSTTAHHVDGPAAAARPSAPAQLQAHMPPPPAGRAWKLLTEPGTQAHFDLDFIGSRYRPLPPASDSRERIREIGESFARLGLGEDRASMGSGEADEADVDMDGGEGALRLSDEHRALVLAGLKPTVQLYMMVGTWRPNRQDAIIEAEKQASDDVGSFFKTRARSPSSASYAATSREGSAAA
ncbi:hypothetical protein JCM3775_004517 [Rhodotorula graminis]